MIEIKLTHALGLGGDCRISGLHDKLAKLAIDRKMIDLQKKSEVQIPITASIKEGGIDPNLISVVVLLDVEDPDPSFVGLLTNIEVILMETFPEMKMEISSITPNLEFFWQFPHCVFLPIK